LASDKERKQIVADYIECNNYSEVARKYNVSVDTVRRFVREDKDFANNLKQKKEENTQSTIEYMQTQHETKKRILDKILKAIEDKSENIDLFTNIKDLATAYGIILDKELKVLELQKNNADSKELSKVEELLNKIEQEAKDDIKW